MMGFLVVKELKKGQLHDIKASWRPGMGVVLLLDIYIWVKDVMGIFFYKGLNNNYILPHIKVF